MRLKFKVQRYQTEAVDAVADCFAGQPRHDGVTYRIDPGRQKPTAAAALVRESRRRIGLAQRGDRAEPGAAAREHPGRAAHRNLPLSPTLVRSRPRPGSPTSTSRWRRAPARPTSTSRRSWS